MVYKRFLIMGLLVLAVLGFSLPAAAKDGWVYGEVTRAPRQIDDRTYIQVDGELYKILPNTRINYRIERRRGAYDEKEASVYSLHKYQDIAMRVRNHQAIQIIIYKR